jgi:integrase
MLNTRRKLNPNQVFYDALLKKRPDLSPKTLYGYADSLKLLYYKVYQEDNNIDVDKFLSKDLKFYTDFIIAEKKSNSYVRNMLSALKSFTDAPELTPYITKAALGASEEADNPIATEYINSHHLTPEMLENKFIELQTEAEPLWTKSEFTMPEFQKLQTFVMYCLVCGKFISPRRSQDWIRFKTRNFDTEIDNWLDKKVFVFNQFKTSKLVGQQRVECPPELYRIMRKWIRFNKTDYLFVNVNLEPLSAVSYGQKLCSIWGADTGKTNGYGTNQMRHIYLTNKYANILDLEKDMKDMGSTINEAKFYIKKIDPMKITKIK